MTDTVYGLVARSRWRIALLFVVVAAVVGLLVLLGREVEHHLLAVERWIRALGPMGLVVFIGILVVCTSLLLPESLFAIAAGALFGLPWGLAVVIVGNLLAAVVQYGLARRLLRGYIQRVLASRPQLAATQRAVLQDEIRLQLLLRLTPLNPATLSYVFGAAGVRFWGFVLGCLGLVPHLLVEVYLGHAGQHLSRVGTGSRAHSFAHEALTFGGLIATGLAVYLVSRIARKAIERRLQT